MTTFFAMAHVEVVSPATSPGPPDNRDKDRTANTVPHMRAMLLDTCISAPSAGLVPKHFWLHACRKGSFCPRTSRCCPADERLSTSHRKPGIVNCCRCSRTLCPPSFSHWRNVYPPRGSSKFVRSPASILGKLDAVTDHSYSSLYGKGRGGRRRYVNYVNVRGFCWL